MNKRRELLEKIFWTSGWIYDFSRLATTILVIGLITHYFFFSILIVRGKSMEPNYYDGEVLVVDKVAYLVGRPKRFDVVAMYYPGETEKRFVKRIIALPKEKLTVLNGKVYINDIPILEGYLDPSLATLPDMEKVLQEGEYFVMGDNRDNSSDSRAWGPVPRSFIVGRVTFPIYRKDSLQISKKIASTN